MWIKLRIAVKINRMASLEVTDELIGDSWGFKPPVDDVSEKEGIMKVHADLTTHGRLQFTLFV